MVRSTTIYRRYDVPNDCELAVFVDWNTRCDFRNWAGFNGVKTIGIGCAAESKAHNQDMEERRIAKSGCATEEILCGRCE